MAHADPAAPHYRLTPADSLAVPEEYFRAPRHLGFTEAEMTGPLAQYFRPQTRPILASARDALLAGPQPAELGYEVGSVVDRLSRPGYEAMETGWTRTEASTLVVACHTDMPDVTAAMWDWWFGWHSTNADRYKVWNPGAHQFAAIADDRSHDRSLTDRQRYQDNVSFVDEYIGDTYNRLAIRFLRPERLGFVDTPGTTHICARVGTSEVPIAVGWLVHQVRPTDHGSEMRSRFFLGHPEVLAIPAHAVTRKRLARAMTGPMRRPLMPGIQGAARMAMTMQYGRALLHHCASEMNHLAEFLPELWAEFRETP